MIKVNFDEKISLKELLEKLKKQYGNVKEIRPFIEEFEQVLAAFGKYGEEKIDGGVFAATVTFALVQMKHAFIMLGDMYAAMVVDRWLMSMFGVGEKKHGGGTTSYI